MLCSETIGAACSCSCRFVAEPADRFALQAEVVTAEGATAPRMASSYPVQLQCAGVYAGTVSVPAFDSPGSVGSVRQAISSLLGGSLALICNALLALVSMHTACAKWSEPY